MDIQAVFGQTAYKKSAVYKWHASFKEGRTKLGDLTRSGAPQIARTCRRIRQCKTLVDNNKRIWVQTLSNTLGISYGSTLRILHKDLNMKKKCAKLIPRQLTPDHIRKRRQFCENMLRQSRRVPSFLSSIVTTDEAWFYLNETRTREENKQWLTPQENCPQVARHDRSCKKLMLIPFFDRKGLVHVETVQNRTIKGEVFKPILQNMREHLLIQRRMVGRQPQRALLHMDNAPAHGSKVVQDWLIAEEWNQLSQPPYSPDLLPCDFFLFPLLKKKLRGHEYGDLVHLSAAVHHELGNITAAQWKHCFSDWLRRCCKCLLFNGNYFKGMKFPPAQ